MTDPTVLVAGETLVDFLPAASGPLSQVETFSRRAGGAAANVSIALARLDTRPWFLTNVSTDGFGDFLVGTLEANGLSDRFVTRSAHSSTLAFVTHDGSADRSFTFYGDDVADRHIRTGVVPEGVLESLEWVCIDAPVALAAEPARSALLALCERADEHGCQVVFDFNTRRSLWCDRETFAETLDTVLDRVGILKASIEDVAGTRFAGEDPSGVAESLLAAGPHTVFLTRGSAGASAVADERSPWGPREIAHAGYEVDPVDTTGAGDAFLAGAIAALAENESLDEALSVANAVAALTTTEQGAIDALPDAGAVADVRSKR